MPAEAKVTFEPSGRTVYVLPNTILLEAAARAGFIIETPCGGAGKCGKCLVRVTAGACTPSECGENRLSSEQIEEGYRLACQCRVHGELVVEIPETSLFQTSQKILAHKANGSFDIQPAVSKEYVELPPPTQDDPASDAERLAEAVRPAELDIDVVRSLPHVLRESEFKVTVTIARNRVVNIEAGDTRARSLGAAFDIGTTTLVGTLVDLLTGKDLAIASRINPQTSFGDDVVSRIKRCREEDDGLAELQGAVIGSINEILEELGQSAGVSPSEMCAAAFAGNTTMQQILCGINPRSLGEIPFVPAFRHSLDLRAEDLGIAIHPNADVVIFPQLGGFVGGDTVAGVLATRMNRLDSPSLLIDVGTNGEIVLVHNGSLIATSVAAGPAFEGARIINGMRATSGAIEKVVIDDGVQINVIGNAAPAGICGTGLIDATAGLLRLGVLESTGRILGPDEMPDTVPDAIRKRVVKNGDQFDFVLAPAEQSASGEPLFLYQRDIRELQLANGAIRAGVSILLGMEGLTPEDLGSVLLAGAFGNFIRRRNARRIGMLPMIPRDRIRFVGNTASFGAKRVLLSSAERDGAEQIMQDTRHVDLSLNPEFQMEFSAAMIFPEDELEE